jgi:hypothetical protein
MNSRPNSTRIRVHTIAPRIAVAVSAVIELGAWSIVTLTLLYGKSVSHATSERRALCR